MEKKHLALVTALLLAAGTLSSCGGSRVSEELPETEINVIVSGTEAPAEDEPEQTDVPSDTEKTEESKSSTSKKEQSETTPAVTTEVTDPDGSPVVTTGGTTAQTELYGLDAPDEELGTEATTQATQATTKSAEFYENLDPVQVDDEKVAEQLAVVDKKPVMTKYDVDPSTRYAYKQLSASEQKLYLDILECAKNAERNVEIGDISNETWIKVFGCVYMQEPELFWLSSKNKPGKLYFWEVDSEVIAPLQKKIDDSVKEILTSAQGKSDFEKIRIFHDWIVLNNDFNKADVSEDEGSWSRYTIYGGFVDGEVQCEGYAKSMQYLCDLSGIQSAVIVGTNSAGSSHAWNVINLGGNWYNVDCTWDDPILSEPVKNNLRHRYFGVPDAWIHEKSHFNINKKTTGTQVMYFTPPSCTGDDMNYFTQTDRLYSDADSAEKAIKQEMKNAVASKTRVAEIRVTSKSVYDEITSRLKGYSTWIKSEEPSVKKVASNCDEQTLVIELDIGY
ncbi:MAG: hypothetical protein J6F31_08135 [Oscillospiraceae bacterium]|nr:hypothetical protein [Oscillospiraceae bacterium]